MEICLERWFQDSKLIPEHLLRGIGFAQWMMKFARTNIRMLQQDVKSSRHGTLYDWKSPRSQDNISRCHIRCLLNAWSIWWNFNVQKQEEEISEFSCFLTASSLLDFFENLCETRKFIKKNWVRIFTIWNQKDYIFFQKSVFSLLIF